MLQIVSAETWEAAHARLERARTAFARSPRDGRLLVGRPAVSDFDSPYLLSGIAKCASCGGSLVSITRDFKGKRKALYGCDRYHKRGATVCRNSLLIRQERLDRVVLQAIADGSSRSMAVRRSRSRFWPPLSRSRAFSTARAMIRSSKVGGGQRVPLRASEERGGQEEGPRRRA